jgi:hypothetical protein
MLFCRFLREARGGKTIWDCDGADLRAYKTVRLRTEGPHRVSASTWRRSVAALDKWVRWSIYEGLLENEPFRYVDRTVAIRGAGFRVASASGRPVASDGVVLDVFRHYGWIGSASSPT